jgi:hypothetical protein
MDVGWEVRLFFCEGIAMKRLWMRRGARTAAAVLLPVLVLGAAAACQKDYGGLPYMDYRGEWHLLMTQQNKETVTNRAGMLLELETKLDGYAKEENGKTMTKPMEYPVFLHDRAFRPDLLELSSFRIEIPKGWVWSEGAVLRFNQEGGEGDTISMSPRRTSYEALVKELQEQAETFTKETAKEAEGIRVTSETKTLLGREAFVLQYVLPGAQEGLSVISMNICVQLGGNECVLVNYLTKSTGADYNYYETIEAIINSIQPK